jgi:methylglutaconyl-CoA hydratase
VIAADDAVFAFSEVKLGIIPAVISPFALTRIGAGPARRYFVTGERFDAATALRIGLVHEVVPRDQLDAAVDRIVAEILTAGPEAARHAKLLVLDAPLDGLETAERIAERRTSAEGQEGLRAFLERRKPSWN